MRNFEVDEFLELSILCGSQKYAFYEEGESTYYPFMQNFQEKVLNNFFLSSTGTTDCLLG